MYLPPWYWWPSMTLVLRTHVDPIDMAEPLREAVQRVDPSQPVFNVRTMDQVVTRNTAPPRLQAALLTAFALLTLLLWAVGVAGVVTYTVTRRTTDLALRMALGARLGQMMWAASRNGLTACCAGLLFGLSGAYAFGQILSSVLYEMRPDDPATFVLVAAIELSVAVAACLIPAWRISRFDLSSALRNN